MKEKVISTYMVTKANLSSQENLACLLFENVVLDVMPFKVCHK